MRKTIIQALKTNKAISLYYDYLPRVIEVHEIGIHKDSGNVVLMGYQVGGQRSPYWKLFDISKITSLKITEQNSQAPRQGYKKGDKHMSMIFDEV